MMDNLEYQELMIDHYLRMALEKGLPHPQTAEVVRLPLTVYKHCTAIFKREHQVNVILCRRVKEMFYFKECTLRQDSYPNLFNHAYLKLLQALNSDKTFYLSQIVVRVVLLGLSIKVGDKDTQVFKCKLQQLLNNLKIQLVFDTRETLSDLIINELQVINECFQSLQYYEQIKAAFQEYDVSKVVKWVDGVLKEKRQKFQAKRQEMLPFKNQQIKMEKKQSKQKSQLKASKGQNREVVFKMNASVGNKDGTLFKDKNSISPKKQRKVSSISLATKMRKSMFVAPMRFSSKYVFRSSKRQLQESRLIYQEQSQVDLDSIKERNSQTWQIQPQKFKLLHQTNDTEQNSRILCPATPPRRAVNTHQK